MASPEEHTGEGFSLPRRRDLPVEGGRGRSGALSRVSAWKPRCLSALASRESLWQTRHWGKEPRQQRKWTPCLLICPSRCHRWKAGGALFNSFYARIAGYTVRSFPTHDQGLVAKRFFFFFFFFRSLSALNAPRLQFPCTLGLKPAVMRARDSASNSEMGQKGLKQPRSS